MPATEPNASPDSAAPLRLPDVAGAPVRVLHVTRDAQEHASLQAALAVIAPRLRLEAVSTAREAAVRLDPAAPPDVVLLDVPLTEADAIAFIMLIRRRAFPTALVVTASPSDEAPLITALDMGADDYVVKGRTSPEELQATLIQAAASRNVAAAAGRGIRVIYVGVVETARRQLAKIAPEILLIGPPSGLDVLPAVPDQGTAEASLPFDALVIEDGTPDVNTLDVMKDVRRRGLDLPVVVVTQPGYENIGAHALKFGAAAHLVKSDKYFLSLRSTLARVVGHARLARSFERLATSEAHLQSIVDSQPVGVILATRDGTLLLANNAGVSALGATARHDLVGRSLYSLVDAADRQAVRVWMKLVCEGHHKQLTFALDGGNGTKRQVEVDGVPFGPGPDQTRNLLAAVRPAPAAAGMEIAELDDRNASVPLAEATARAEQLDVAVAGVEKVKAALVEAEARAEQLAAEAAAVAPMRIALAEAEARAEQLAAEAAAAAQMRTAVAEATARAERLAVEAAAVAGMRTALAEAEARAERLAVEATALEETKTALAEAMAHTERLTAEAAALGNMKTALAEAEARAERLAAEAAAVGEMRTALAEAQARAEQLEAELAAGAAAAAAVAVPTRDAVTLDHLQRLERVGQLATGVSEDWARLLDTVDEHARALLSTLPSGADEQYNVKRIIEAAERGKPLARQLLAFSRKQTQRPSPLDVNQVLTGMEPLLRQIAGEAIDLSLSLDSPLAAVQADREDLQRAVAALVLLGRDLLPFGGSISLRTAQAASEPGCAGPRGPGVRVELGIDAAGRGMDQAIQERLLRTADAAASPTPTELDSTQKLVADQGGELKVGGEPGWRTTFTLRLPGVRVD